MTSSRPAKSDAPRPGGWCGSVWQRLSLRILGLTLAPVLAGSCAISPKPEPPGPGTDLNLGEVTTHDTGTLGPKAIEGGPGAAGPPGAVVRAFNLELPEDPAEAEVAADGSFEIEMTLLEGDEVRLQVIAGALRSDPLDVVVGPDDTSPVPAVRPLADCLLLEPALELDAALADVVQVRNRCADPVTIDAPYVRRPVVGLDIGEGGTWPAVLPPNLDVPVAVQFQAPVGALEEIVFIEISAPVPDRRPITVLPRSP